MGETVSLHRHEARQTLSEHQLRHMSNIQLVQYVLERFHAVHRTQLETAIELAQRVESVHAGEPLCPNGLHDHLLVLQAELLHHMFKEEQILFPMLMNGQRPTGPILAMESEHEEHAASINHLIDLTGGFDLPSDACGSWRELYRILKEFVADLELHIKIENDILFISEAVRHGTCCGGCQ